MSKIIVFFVWFVATVSVNIDMEIDQYYLQRVIFVCKKIIPLTEQISTSITGNSLKTDNEREMLTKYLLTHF